MCIILLSRMDQVVWNKLLLWSYFLVLLADYAQIARPLPPQGIRIKSKPNMQSVRQQVKHTPGQLSLLRALGQ